MYTVPNSLSWSAFVMWVVIFFTGLSVQPQLLQLEEERKKNFTKNIVEFSETGRQSLEQLFLLVNPYITCWQGHQCCQHFFPTKFSLSFFQKSNFWGNHDSSVILLTPLNFSFCCQSPVTVSWWSWLMAKYVRIVKRALNIESKTIISCSYFLSTIRS